MSAPSCVVFYGFEIDIADHDLGAFEAGSHEVQRAAKRLKLDLYWGNCASPAEHWVALAGIRIALIGPEADPSASIATGELLSVSREADGRLRELLPSLEPTLILRWFAD